MANFMTSGGKVIRAVTNPLRSFLFLFSGVSLASLEPVVISVDGTSIEASFSGADPSSPADISMETVCKRFVMLVPEGFLKRGDDIGTFLFTVLMLAGVDVETVKPKTAQADTSRANIRILDTR